jgi:hypothetical protein
MNVIPILFGLVSLLVLAIATINLYLLRIIRKLEIENDSLQPPF